MCDIKSRYRSLVDHHYIQASSKRGEILYDVLPMESDNRADTDCFGANLRPMMCTRKQCNVSQFLTEYSGQNDVPIVTGVTDFDTKNGKTYLIVFGQRIWFGNQIRK